MYCGECGTKNSEDSLFCENCGARLGSVEPKQSQTVNNKKKRSIGVIIGLLVVLILLGIYFGKDYFSNDNIKTSWGNTYYLYLKENIDNDSLDEIALDDINNSKISFIEVSDIEEPVMVINYEKEDNYHTNIYYIESDEVRGYSVREGNLKFLYDIEDEEYNYFIYDEDSNTFTLVDGVIDSDKEKVYTIDGENDITVTSDDEKITLTEYEQTFVEVDIDNSVTFDINNVKEIINDYEYQTKDEIITDEVKENVEDVLSEIEDKKDKIEEIEENTPKTFKVGNYTLEFGTYTGSDSYNGATDDSAIWCDLKVVLKSDYTFEMTFYNISDGRDDEVVTGTFVIEPNTFGTGYDGLIFYKGEETTSYRSYGVLANNSFEQLAGSGYKYTLES